MKGFLSLAFVLCSFFVTAQPPKNLTLLGELNFPGQRVTGCWHYDDSSGNEYAIVGASNGIAIVDITNPAVPTLLFQLPGINNLYHEVKVLGNFAYAVSEGLDTFNVIDGMQIIDLRYLPDSAPVSYYHGDGAIAGLFRIAHTITADNGYVYLNGHNITSLNRGVLILDVSNPLSPVYVGADTNRYCHDSYVRGDYLFASDILDGMFSVYDITNRASPVLLATQITPGGFTHNTWISNSGDYLFAVDEMMLTSLVSYDITNMNNITQLDTFYNDNMSGNEVHNVRVLNDFLICPSYGSQLTLVDAANPKNLIEIGNYTTGTTLCWDADPFLASGNIIATDNETFFVFAPNYVRACYLEGNITDSITGLTIANVSVAFPSLSITDISDYSGNYATGYADSGTYAVTYSAPGYNTYTDTVTLTNGNTTTLDVQLVPIGTNIQTLDIDEINIYPNPATDNLQINSKQNIESWKLIDAQGRVVKEEENIHCTDVNINTAGYERGIYTIEMHGSEQSVFRKIVLD
jgi:choice-of-anchor B domain-containing protein